MARRCGVLGSPIAHSLSPALHRAAYRELGLDWSYDVFQVNSAGLPAFVNALGADWRGLSLTMPLKEAAIALCANVGREAGVVGAANTLLLDEPAGVVGENTDVPGFVTAWREAGITAVERAVVLGAGATARSAVAALAQVGVARVVVLARAPQRTGAVVALLDALGLDHEVLALEDWAAAGPADLAISTLPGDATAEWPDLPEGLASTAGAVSDVGYGPLVTSLVAAARRAGLPCADGFGLLLHQAARQVELMTGTSAAPLDAMREAGLRALAQRETPA